MPDPTPAPTTPAPAPAKPALKSFKDPDFIKRLEAGYANAAAIAEGKPPTTPTDDSPAAPSQPTDGAAPAGAAKQAAEEADASAASPAHTATQPADPPFDKKKSADWAAMRDSHKRETDRLRIELEEAKKGTDVAYVDQLRSEIETYQRELRLVAVERDPVFNKEWKQKTDDAVTRLKAAAGKNGDTLAQIAQLPPGEHRDKLITETIGELPSWKQSEIAVAIADLSRLSGERQTLIERTRASLDAQAHQAEAKRLAEVRAQSALFDSTVETWRDAGLDALAANDSSKLEEALALARNAYSGNLEPKALANFAVWGGVGPLLLQDSMGKAKLLEARDTEIAALKATIARLSGSQPLAGGGAPATPSASEAPATKPANMSFGEWTAAQALKEGLVSR